MIHLIIAITYIAYIIVDSVISVAIAWVIIIILIININTYKVTKLFIRIIIGIYCPSLETFSLEPLKI